jgi:hypothetical protein
MADEDIMRGPDEMDLPDQPGLSDAEMAAMDLGIDTEEEPLPQGGDVLEVETMEAQMTVIGSVSSSEFSAVQSLIGSASVAGDAEISASVLGMMTAGSADVQQGGAVLMMIDGDASIDQGGAQVIVAQRVDVESGGAGVLVTNEASLARSWVGIMAARNATLSDDSRVVIDTRAALIIGGLLAGGLGLVAVAVLLGARRLALHLPHMPFTGHAHPAMRALRSHGLPRVPHLQMPDIPKAPDMPKMPDLSALADLVAKLRRAV